MALVIGSSLAVSGNPPPPDAAQLARDHRDEERVLEDLGQVTNEECLSADDAKRVFRQRLDALGLPNWTIRDDGRTRDAPCVTGAPIGENREVLLMSSMGMRVSDALERLKVDLLSRCLDPDEALQLLRATLEAAGVADPIVAIKGINDPLSGPVGLPGPPNGAEAQAYMQHIADGCVVFGDAQSSQTGLYTWTLRTR
jgi:hypothetical protein